MTRYLCVYAERIAFPQGEGGVDQGQYDQVLQFERQPAGEDIKHGVRGSREVEEDRPKAAQIQGKGIEMNIL